MYLDYLENPLNKRKKKYKYFLRITENILKKILVYFIVLPLLFPFFIKNYFTKYKLYSIYLSNPKISSQSIDGFGLYSHFKIWIFYLMIGGLAHFALKV